MKIKTSFIFGLVMICGLMRAEAHAALSITQNSLMTDLQTSPLLIEDLKHPAFSWRSKSNQRGEKQRAYRIVVTREHRSTDLTESQTDLVWDSGKVLSDASSGVRYAGPVLKSATRYFWRVQVWDQDDKPSELSTPTHFDTALGNTWQAKPVWLSGPAWKNYTVEFDLKITNASAGFYLLASDRGAYRYQFRLPENVNKPTVLMRYLQTQESIREAGSPGQLTRHDINLLPNTFCRIKFVIEGNVITVLVNGAVVDRNTDVVLTEGAFGVWAENREDRFTIRNLSVRSGDHILYRNAFDGNLGSPFPVPSVGISNGELTVGLNKQSPLYNEVTPTDAVIETRPDWVFLRKTFRIKDKPVSRVILYATGQTPEATRQYVYKAYLNGHFVGLGPARGYDDKHFYNAFDITHSLIKNGENVISAVAFTYGINKSFMAEVRVTYQDGETETIGTDEGWKIADGSSAFPYLGDVHAPGAVAWVGFRYPHENIVAAHYPQGFGRPGFDDSRWLTASVQPAIKNLTGYPAENLSETVVRPQRISQISPGHYILDYGITVVGGMRLNVGSSGALPFVVKLKTGEVLDNTGKVKWQTAALVNNLDSWTIPPEGADVTQFGFRVFRYAEVSGLPDAVNKKNLSAHLQAIALRYPFDEKAASFKSSDPELDKIWTFSRDSIRVLNHDLYVDSPNRERAPYEADTYIQQLSNYQLDRGYSLARLSTAWLIDHSTWPMEWKVYNILNSWNDYLYTGDDRLIRDTYAQLQQKLPGKLTRGFSKETGLVTADYGDGKPGPDHDIVDWPASLRAGYQFSDTHNVANAFFYRGTLALADIAAALGKNEDAEKYRKQAQRAAEGFRIGFYDKSAGAFRDNIGGKHHVSSQANAFSVAFGIADMSEAESAAKYLASKKMLEGSVYSSVFALKAMADNGQGGEAISQITGLNRNGTLRSGTHNWRHMIELGSGSTMEAWNETDDLTVSHSHPWGTAPVIITAESLFGIVPLSPAYALFRIKPILRGLQSAQIEVPTIRGDIRVSFTRAEKKWVLNASVPANTEALIYVPAGKPSLVKESGSALNDVKGIKSVDVDGDYIKVRVGSGEYHFTSSER